ncbi:MAG: aminodeoxychorismate/anthranilate synthase component II [Rikenellaceae bacterium]
MKILLLDNYDSFTYNVAEAVKSCGEEIDIFRNDKISLEDVGGYDKIILSPGPGVPKDAGILLPLIKRYGATKHILGICLGEQAIGEAYGAMLTNLSTVYHGVASTISITDERDPILKGLGSEIEVGRYHSWVVSTQNFPDCLEITSTHKESGQIMSLRHKEHKVYGVQFHPESILTPKGVEIIANFLKL